MKMIQVPEDDGENVRSTIDFFFCKIDGILFLQSAEWLLTSVVYQVTFLCIGFICCASRRRRDDQSWSISK